MAKSLASVADPPFPKIISFPPRRKRSSNGQRSVADCSLSFPCHLCAHIVSSWAFIRMEDRDICNQVGGSLFFLPKKRIEKLGFAHVVPEFAVLEENMHRLPERMVQNFDHLLMHERISGWLHERVNSNIKCDSGQPEGHRLGGSLPAASPKLPGRLPADQSPSQCLQDEESLDPWPEQN